MVIATGKIMRKIEPGYRTKQGNNNGFEEGENTGFCQQTIKFEYLFVNESASTHKI
jgi:hypothetical protein